MDVDLNVALAIAVPALVITVGLLLNAYLLYRRPTVAARDGNEAVDRRLDEIVTSSSDELLVTLQHSIDEVKGQLAGQSSVLAGLLSDGSPPPPSLDAVLQGIVPATAGAAIAVEAAPAEISDAERLAQADSGADFLRRVVHSLVAEGLSDRAIARRLSVGLEEVQLARRTAGGAQ